LIDESTTYVITSFRATVLWVENIQQRWADQVREFQFYYGTYRYRERWLFL
jgi:hypothetical protein